MVHQFSKGSRFPATAAEYSASGSHEHGGRGTITHTTGAVRMSGALTLIGILEINDRIILWIAIWRLYYGLPQPPYSQPILRTVITRRGPGLSGGGPGGRFTFRLLEGDCLDLLAVAG
jgi:hypothetical protein